MALILLVVCGAMAAGFIVNGERRQARLLRSDPNLVANDPVLLGFALRQGAPIFAEHCAPCHGEGGKGNHATGVPDLTDDDRLYGDGQPGDAERIVTYGIRSHNPKGWNLAVMPAFARPVPSAGQPGLQPLSPGDIRDVTEFLLSLQQQPPDESGMPDLAARGRGAAIFSGRGACYDCHAPDGQGDAAIGAPNLADKIWLYGDGSRAAIAASISYGLQGVCPGWIGKLSAGRIRAVSLYVYALSHSVHSPPDSGRSER